MDHPEPGGPLSALVDAVRKGLEAAFPGAEVSVDDPTGVGRRLVARVASAAPWSVGLAERYARLARALDAELASGHLVTLSVTFAGGGSARSTPEADERGGAGELVFPEGLGLGDDA